MNPFAISRIKNVSQALPDMSGLKLILIVLLAGCSYPTENQPAPKGNQSEEKTAKVEVKKYDGKTLSAWKKCLKNFDPQDKDSLTTIPGLLEIVEDGSVPWFTRKTAALALARLGAPAKKTIPVFVHLSDAEHHSEETQLWATKAIARFGPVASESTPLLRERLRSEKTPETVRLVCIDALSRIGLKHPEALPALIETLKDNRNSTLLHAGAIEAMIFLGSSAAPATPSLINALSNSEEAIRSKSAQALAAIGPLAESAITPLAEILLLDDSNLVRKNAAIALGRMGAAAHPVLSRLVKDDDPKVRQFAIIAFSNKKRLPLTTQKEIFSLLADSDDVVQISAVEFFFTNSPKPERQEKLIKTAIQLLQSKNHSVRLRAMNVITSQNSDTIKPYLESIQKNLHSPRPEIRTTTRELLKRLNKKNQQ